jgi:ABC-2 type transport system permease protein
MARTASAIPRAHFRPDIVWAFSDTWELFKRTLIQIRQTPGDLFSFVIVQPVLLIVLFRYVFGGAVETNQDSYANFLIPGVIAANAALISMTAAVGVANDMTNGIVDRFRSLPMSRTAILGGTVLANTARGMAAMVAMVLIGLLVGFRPDADLGAWLAVIGLLLLVTYAFSWLLAALGLLAGSVEAAWQMGALLWPLTFVSSAYVPPESMPSGLETFAGAWGSRSHRPRSPRRCSSARSADPGELRSPRARGKQMAASVDSTEVSRRLEDVFAYATDFSHFRASWYCQNVYPGAAVARGVFVAD